MINVLNIFQKDPNEELLLDLHIYIDKKFAFSRTYYSSARLIDLKYLISIKSNLDDINYKIYFNNLDISKLDDFSFNEIILMKNKSHYDFHVIKNKEQLDPPSPIILSYREGEPNIMIFKTKLKKFDIITPRTFPFCPNYFPYNSRYCSVINENKLVICGSSGDSDISKSIYYYDYKINDIVPLPEMKIKRERHSMISIGIGRVFIVGGDNCKKVTCINYRSDLYQEYPDMKLERMDCSLCYVDEKYIYAFMGFNQEANKILDNYERIDVSKRPFSADWELLSLKYEKYMKIPRTYCGIIYNENDKSFVFIGGNFNGTNEDTVLKLKRNEVNVLRFEFCECKTLYGLAFDENTFHYPVPGSEEYFIFEFGNRKNVVMYDTRWNKINIFNNKF